MDTLTASLVAVHIVISIALIGLVLLNSGKGGGLSDMLGGPGASGNIGQTLAERNLSRITAAGCSFVFCNNVITFLVS